MRLRGTEEDPLSQQRDEGRRSEEAKVEGTRRCGHRHEARREDPTNERNDCAPIGTDVAGEDAAGALRGAGALRVEDSRSGARMPAEGGQDREAVLSADPGSEGHPLRHA